MAKRDVEEQAKKDRLGSFFEPLQFVEHSVLGLDDWAGSQVRIDVVRAWNLINQVEHPFRFGDASIRSGIKNRGLSEDKQPNLYPFFSCRLQMRPNVRIPKAYYLPYCKYGIVGDMPKHIFHRIRGQIFEFPEVGGGWLQLVIP